MKWESEFVFEASQQEVWNALQDPDVLVGAVPGTKSLSKIGEAEFVGDMHMQVGPLNGLFTGRVLLTDRIEPKSYSLNVDAKGPLGFGKGTGTVELVAEDDSHTRMKYTMDLQVGGKLAGLGQRLLETVSQSLSRQSLQALNEAIRSRKAGRAIQAPGQTKFAMAVGKDLLGNMLTPSRLLVGASIVIALVLLLWWLTKNP